MSQMEEGDNKDDYPHVELTRDIIGAAMFVLNELRPGLDEKLYENALAIELKHRGHKVDQQKNYPVEFKGERIGTLIPDVVVDDSVIVDPKVAQAFSESHTAQMIGYLAITGLDLALLLNFKYSRLQFNRVIRQEH